MKQKTKRAKRTIKYTTLLRQSTPGPYRANSGRHNHAEGPNRSSQTMRRHWLVETNLVTNGPEATICNIGCDIWGRPENPVIHDSFGNPPDHRFKNPTPITDAQHKANAALLAHSANVLPEAYGVMIAVRAYLKESILHESNDYMRMLNDTIAKIERVKVWVGQ